MDSGKAFSRRRLVKIGLIGGGSAAALAALAGCGETQIVEKEVVKVVTKEVPVDKIVTQIVEKEKVVEKAVEKIVTKEVEKIVEKVVTKEVPVAPQKVTITTSHSWPEDRYKEQIEFDDLFMKRQPNIVVDRRNTVWAEYWTKTAAQAASGTLPDVFYNQDTRIAQYMKSDSYVSLNEFMARETANFGWGTDFIDTPKPIVSSGGKVFAIPYDWGGPVLIYNVQHFDTKGAKYPDEKWTNEDILAYSKEVSQPDKRQWGYNHRYWGNWGHEGIYLRQFGGLWLSDDGEKQIKGVFDSPESLKANEFWSNFTTKWKVTPTPADAEALGRDPMTGGNVSLNHAPPWAGPTFNANKDLKWDIAPSELGPKGRFGAALGSNYGIAKNSKVAESAWAYLRDYMSTEGMNFMWTSRGTGIVARKSAQVGFTKSPNQPKHVQYWVDAVNTYLVAGKPLTPNSNEILRIFAEVFKDLLLGAIKLDAATKRVVDEVDPLLKVNR